MKRKWLAVGIILLFVGITVNPITGIPSNRDDTTPPMTTISFNPPVPDGMNGWYVSPVTVTLNATDNESGVWRTFCNLSPGGNYTEPILVSQDGIYEITFYSIDYAGNVEATKSVWIKIDKTPPKVIMDWDWEQVGSVINIIVTATCTDEMSSISKVEFYFNDELQETVTGAGPDYFWTFQFTPLLSFTIKAVAPDSAGNTGVGEIVFRYKTFLAGLITELNDAGGGFISFKATFVFFIVFDPFDMGRVIPNEEIFIFNEYQGYIGPRVIFGIFPSISIEYP